MKQKDDNNTSDSTETRGENPFDNLPVELVEILLNYMRREPGMMAKLPRVSKLWQSIADESNGQLWKNTVLKHIKMPQSAGSDISYKEIARRNLDPKARKKYLKLYIDICGQQSGKIMSKLCGWNLNNETATSKTFNTRKGKVSTQFEDYSYTLFTTSYRFSSMAKRSDQKYKKQDTVIVFLNLQDPRMMKNVEKSLAKIEKWLKLNKNLSVHAVCYTKDKSNQDNEECKTIQANLTKIKDYFSQKGYPSGNGYIYEVDFAHGSNNTEENDIKLSGIFEQICEVHLEKSAIYKVKKDTNSIRPSNVPPPFDYEDASVVADFYTDIFTCDRDTSDDEGSGNYYGMRK